MHSVFSNFYEDRSHFQVKGASPVPVVAVLALAEEHVLTLGPPRQHIHLQSVITLVIQASGAGTSMHNTTNTAIKSRPMGYIHNHQS
jgi:hypothetical protein